jgi:gamma-glutamylcyclotransferase (GGCT)/AIG2-like uncharacterized protein YtfP
VKRVRLFVYGSLKRGGLHHEELADAVCVGVARTAPLYRVAAFGLYPALVFGNTAVTGELYDLVPDALPALDAFEGPGYRRALVELADGSVAEAYFLAEAAHA